MATYQRASATAQRLLGADHDERAAIWLEASAGRTAVARELTAPELAAATAIITLRKAALPESEPKVEEESAP